MDVGELDRELKSQIVARYGSQRTFARELKFGEDRVSMVLRGRYNLTNGEQSEWARALETTPEELFTSRA